MSDSPRKKAFVRIFGSALIMQAMLSATNFFIGLTLIRGTTDLQYGYFVLVTTGALLLSGLQSSFIQPPMVIRMTRSNVDERADLVGGLYRSQRQIVIALAGLSVLISVILRINDFLHLDMFLLSIATIAALSTTLYREFFRMVLLSHRQSHQVLKADACYVVLLLLGIPLATHTTAPAATAIFVMSAAALIGGLILSRFMWQFEPWNRQGPRGMLKEMFPLGSWSSLGASTHWAFSQGYNYLVAGILATEAVAALAATRLLLMPINLLSSGIASQMLPTASVWLQFHGPAKLFKRLFLIAFGLGGLAACYVVFVWIFREDILTKVMHKHFEQGDILIAAWSAVFIVMVFRDQLHFLLGASGLHRLLMGVTGVSAITALAVGWIAIRQLGPVGAPVGVLTGEILNLIGIVILSLRHIRQCAQRELAAPKVDA